MNRRIEVWSTPDDPGGFRWLCSPPIISASTMDRAVDEVPGAGSVTIPANYPYLSLILDLDPSDVAGSAASSLIVVLQENPNPASGSGEPETIWEPIFEFFAEDHTEKLTDTGPAITISGPHIRSALDDGVVYPKSTYEPHYQWGAPTLTQNADLSESTLADEEINLWTTATSGSFTLDVNSSGTPATIDFDFTASEVKTALEGLSTVTDVRVSGAGTAADPWRVIFVDPGAENLTFLGDESGLTGGTLSLEIVVEGGQSTPSYWQKSQTIEGVEYGDHGGGSMAVVDDPDSGSTDKALYITGVSEFIGAQQIIDVEPSSTGYATVELWTPSATDEFRLVARTATLEEGFIGSTGGSAGFEGVTVTPDQWNTLTISNIQLLPRHGDQIILRIAVVSEGNPSNFWVKNLRWHPGLPGTTAGDISQILSVAASGTRGALSWLDLSDFDDTLDSNGASWDTSDLAFQADAGEKLGTHVHGDLQQMGYEVDLVRIPADELGSDDLTHRLRLFNPGGRGAAAGPNTAIVVGSGISSGDISKRRVPFTHVLVETYDGLFVEVTDARVSGLPRREHFVRAEQARDVATATKVGEAVLDAAIENLFAAQVTLVGDTTVAYRDFEIGSQVPYTLGENRASKHTRRIHTISMSFDGTRWADTITASKIYAGTGTDGGSSRGGDSPLMLEAMRKLYARFDRRRRPERRSKIIQPPPAASVFTDPTEATLSPNTACSGTGSGTSHAWNLPLGSAGDLGIVAIGFDPNLGTRTLTTPPGWTLISSGGEGQFLEVALFYRIFDGTETPSATYETSSSSQTVAITWIIESNGADLSTLTPSAAFAGSTSGGVANPPAVSPAEAPATFFAFAGSMSNSPSFDVDATPSGYENLTDCSSGSTLLMDVNHALLEVTTTEDPAAYGPSLGAPYRWASFTLLLEQLEGSPGLAAGDHIHGGDSATAGQVWVANGSGSATWQDFTIDDLTDVDTSTAAPTDGQLLVWDATEAAWLPASFTIDDLTDVDTSTAAPTDGQLLVWDATEAAWLPADAEPGSSATDTHLWRPLLDDAGTIVTDDTGAAVMGFGPA